MEEQEKEVRKEIIERFAAIQGISYEEANTMIGADTDEEVLKNLSEFTINKIKSHQAKPNRAQRRALQKKYGKNAVQASLEEQQAAINETAKKLNYIDLIQKFRALNERKAKENEENGETTNEDN